MECSFQDEAKSRLVVLTRLGHITKDSVLTLKVKKTHLKNKFDFLKAYKVVVFCRVAR